ncbi:MAG TPA: hypothetical protein VLB04_03455 [Methanotrichaceae archaeon]|nr:hypothetical protein [Methanotrichaceae archaeon]
MKQEWSSVSLVKRMMHRMRHSFFLFGLLSLIWFLFKTGTKPSRVCYPCQQASAFTGSLWLMSYVLLPLIAFKHPFNFQSFKDRKVILAGVLLVLVSSLLVSTNVFSAIDGGQVASAAQEATMKLSTFYSQGQSPVPSDKSAINGTSTKSGSAEVTNKNAIDALSDYSSDISRRWDKIREDIKELQNSGAKGTSISAVYANTTVKRSIPPNTSLSLVGFSSMDKEPSDEEVHKLVDDAITQVLGPRGLSE